ncbi:putative mfs transporter protein [Lasiodiplodia theobromae]|uniref:MFS transporter n=1 Tax=Lasiodiplodia theobromae TaxID=45133 RepID=UPI0015C36055|nr:MFS transporter [Lasiodiplodia theobromae]KAF4534024.1 MFS transporter [Lasiodiplodia theobromae]KAF9633129.1 putative mfs transporter protein [Lasiodiplodia theobromae]
MPHHDDHHEIRMSQDGNGEPLTRRTSALEEVPTLVPPAGLPGIPIRRTSTTSRVTFEDERPEGLEALARSASAISGHHYRHESQDNVFELPSIQRPKPAKPGAFSTIRELPSNLNTPLSTRPPSPASNYQISRPPSPGTSSSGTRTPAEYENGVGQAYPEIGTIASWRGAMILLCTCGAQLMDNVFMTGVNIALPAIQKNFDVDGADLQWLISAYTLTFGGFLLLSGVLADRFGRKMIFCAGMATLSVWTLADGLATSFIQLAIFRAIQGIGAAMTVPSAVGIISNYFIAKDRTLALTIFGAAGAVGFCIGLIFGGFLTSSLGWRYIFFIAVGITGSLGAISWFVLPKDRLEGNVRPKLDFVGAGLSTAGLILLSFVLSSGGEYGWGKAFIIVLLILSVLMLVAFTWVEKKVANPIMPLSLWKLENFAALWIGGFVMYGGYQTIIYYTTLIAQEINQLSAGQTALRFLPMGATGFIFSLSMSRMLEIFNTKYLLITGMAICAIAPIPSALIKEGDINFWKHVFPSSILSVAGTTIVYCTITVVLLASVPVNVKSLCGGMINTAFQIGSGVGLALASAIVQAVDTSKGHGPMQQYGTGLWCCVGLAGVGMVASTFGVKNVGKPTSGPVMAH